MLYDKVSWICTAVEKNVIKIKMREIGEILKINLEREK